MSKASRGTESSSPPHPSNATNTETHELGRGASRLGPEAPKLEAKPTRDVVLPLGRTVPPPLATSRSDEQPSKQCPDEADALWAEFQDAFENFGTLTLRADEAQYIGLRAIARLYRHHAGRWSYFLASKGMKRQIRFPTDCEIGFAFEP
jgi:hypothetical protein